MADLRSHLQGALGSSYTLERELGGGGMSRVFLAEESALGRKVVVKVIPEDVTAGVNIDRFRREIQVSAKLQHAHIVPVLATGEIDGVPYYTMPFVEGESLRARLQRTGALPIAEAVSILRDVARALAYAHDHGVVHRDIKPDNILLAGGAAVVADFGIAKAISAARGDAGNATLTQIGTALGTPAYMAPEQAAADPATNHRADIYAFGCVAYELLTGRPPFVEKNPQRLLASHMGQAPEPVSMLRPDTPAALAHLVMRCLEKDADARPQSSAEVLGALDGVTSGGSHSALPPVLLGRAGTLGRALLLYGVAFVVVLIVARAAVVGIGLPDWVVAGAALVMAAGLPVILFTAYTERAARRAFTLTPPRTPGGTTRAPGTLQTLALKASPHVTWRRTAMGGLAAVTAFVLLVGGFMLLRALGIGPAGSLFAAGQLAENDQLLVAQFDVSGSADTSLGSVVAEAIRTDLEQSKAVTIAPASVVRGALQRMRRPPDVYVELPVALDLARREGMKAVVHGDITPLGAGFIVTARLVATESENVLASFRETADGPSGLIPSVERLSRSLRAKMGESLRAVRATPPLEEVTTPSLEALRKYTEGNVIGQTDIPRGVALLKEAIAIDSGFAMAWRRLAVLYTNGFYPADVRDSAAARAYRFRARLTPTERENVEAYYYGTVIGDRAREVAVYEAIQARGEFGPHTHNLGLRLASRREFARAETLYRAHIASGKAALVTYGNLTVFLLGQNRFSEVDSMIRLISRQFGEGQYLDQGRMNYNYALGRMDSAFAAMLRVQSGPDIARRSLGWTRGGNLFTVLGRLSDAEGAFARARTIDSARGGQVRPLFDSVRSAMFDAWFRGRSDRAVRRLDGALARPLTTLPFDQRPYFLAATAYAIAGRPDRARQMLARYAEEVRDTVRHRIDQPEWLRAEAEIALAERRHAEALALFRRSEMLPDGPAHMCVACTDAFLGRAFDLAAIPDSAVTYLERFITGSGYPRLEHLEADALFRAPAHKRLGELYAIRGDTARALAHYRTFVNFWKEADAELQPAVADVRRRIARLTPSEGR